MNEDPGGGRTRLALIVEGPFESTGDGQIGVSGNTVTYAGTVIGVMAGGAGAGVWTFWKARLGRKGLGFVRRQQLGP